MEYHNEGMSYLQRDPITNLEQEVAETLTGRPDRALWLKKAMEEGRITGSDYVHLDIPECGCYYGTIRSYNEDVAIEYKLDICSRMPSTHPLGFSPAHTFIESLLAGVVPGNTPKNNKCLQKLYILTLPFCSEDERTSLYTFE